MLDEVERAVVGKRAALELVLLGLLADGHVLLEDYPGLAKTLIARSFAQVAELDFARIQFTPDLMPSDVTGSSVYDQRNAEFEFRPGPIFTNLLLADEINRAPPKTQAALLEAMQERQVTTEGETRLLDRPFLVLATQNPIEYEGTYPLPEAQLDRFLLRIGVGYPEREDELACSNGGASAGRTRSSSTGSSTATRCGRCSRRSRTSTSPRASATTSSTSSAPPARARACRSAPARAARLAILKLARAAGPARRPRLRDPRRREGGRGARARPPPVAEARAVGAAGPGRGRRRGAARDGADTARRGRPAARGMTRGASPKLGAYAALAGLGLIAALVTGRPELAVVSLPFLAVLVAGLAPPPTPDSSSR